LYGRRQGGVDRANVQRLVEFDCDRIGRGQFIPVPTQSGAPILRGCGSSNLPLAASIPALIECTLLHRARNTHSSPLDATLPLAYHRHVENAPDPGNIVDPARHRLQGQCADRKRNWATARVRCGPMNRRRTECPQWAKRISSSRRGHCPQSQRAVRHQARVKGLLSACLRHRGRLSERASPTCVSFDRGCA